MTKTTQTTQTAAHRVTYLAARRAGANEPDSWLALIAEHGLARADASRIGREIETGFTSPQAARTFYAATDNSEE